MNIQETPSNDPGLPQLFYYCVGKPTPQKVKDALKEYTQPGFCLFSIKSQDQLVAFAGVEIMLEIVTIHHLAVLPDYRHNGYGRLLIVFLQNRFPEKEIHVETDTESIKFYEKCGFSYYAFKGKFGNTRYRCRFRK